MMRVHQDERFFINFFRMEAVFWFFPAILMSSTYIDKNKPCFRWTNKHSQFGTFSHPSSNRVSSNCLSHNNPANGCPYKFRSRGTTASSMFAHDLGHLCRGRCIHTSGPSDFGILGHLGASSNFTWVYADTASAACPSQPGNLAIKSTTFAAVIRVADEPCSVKNCISSRVVFYNVTTEHDSAFLLLYFWISFRIFWGDIRPSM